MPEYPLTVEEIGTTTAGAPVTVGPSAVVTVADAMAINAVSVTATFAHVQDLHGYTKPWAAGAGANMLNCDGYSFVTDANTIKTVYPDYTVELTAGVTYTISCRQTGDAGSCVRNALGIFLNGTSTNKYESTLADPSARIHSFQYTPNTTGTYKLMYWSHTCTNSVTIDQLQVEVGSSYTGYAAYSNVCPITGHTGANITVSPTNDPDDGTTHAIDWSDEGTMYDGTVEAVSGTLTATTAGIASYAGEALPGAWISSLDEYAVGTTPTTGAQVVYELAEPVTYQLDPTAIPLAAGTNYITADTGDVTLQYCQESTATTVPITAHMTVEVTD